VLRAASTSLVLPAMAVEACATDVTAAGETVPEAPAPAHSSSEAAIEVAATGKSAAVISRRQPTRRRVCATLGVAGDESREPMASAEAWADGSGGSWLGFGDASAAAAVGDFRSHDGTGLAAPTAGVGMGGGSGGAAGGERGVGGAEPEGEEGRREELAGDKAAVSCHSASPPWDAGRGADRQRVRASRARMFWQRIKWEGQHLSMVASSYWPRRGRVCDMLPAARTRSAQRDPGRTGCSCPTSSLSFLNGHGLASIPSPFPIFSLRR